MNQNFSPIASRDLTVVVQGAVGRDGATFALLQAIRHYLPESRTILSTWEECDTYGLAADDIVKQPMPPAEILDHEVDAGKANNLGRQIATTRSAIARARTPYLLKLRTDARLEGNGFLRHIGTTITADPLKIGIKERILIGRYYTASYLRSSSLFCFSDIWMAGRTEDIRRVWDLEPPTEPEFTHYLKIHPEKFAKEVAFPNRFIRCMPEQYVWTTLLQDPPVFPEGIRDFRMPWLARHLLLINNYIRVLGNQTSQIALPTHLAEREDFIHNLAPHMNNRSLGWTAAWILAISSNLVVRAKRNTTRRAFEALLASFGIQV